MTSISGVIPHGSCRNGLDPRTQNRSLKRTMLNFVDACRYLLSAGENTKHDATAKFLPLAESAASALNVRIADRSYRKSFTERYKRLYPDAERRYSMYVSDAATDSDPIVVNGTTYEISQTTRLLGRRLVEVIREVCQVSVECDILVFALKDRHHIASRLALLDESWARFEESCIRELINIEAAARQPLISAIACDSELRLLEEACVHMMGARAHSNMFRIAVSAASYSRSDRPKNLLKQLVEQAATLNVLANVKGRGRGDLIFEVVEAAADLYLCPLGSSDKADDKTISFAASAARRMFGSLVLKGLALLRRHFVELGNNMDSVDPQLSNNIVLVERLAGWEEAWELGARFFFTPGLIDGFCLASALLADAADFSPAFRRMLSDHDLELFLVIPRLFVLCCLAHPDLAVLLENFLPHHFFKQTSTTGSQSLRDCGCDDAADAHLTVADGVKQINTAVDRQEVLEVEAGLSQTVTTLIEHFAKVTSYCDRAHEAWREVVQWAISVFGSRQTRDIETERDMILLDFFKQLESVSMELQRHDAQEWNRCCRVLLQCTQFASEALEKYKRNTAASS